MKRPDFKDKRTWIYLAIGFVIVLLAFMAGVLVRGWISPAPLSWGYAKPTTALPVTSGKPGAPTQTGSPEGPLSAAGNPVPGEKGKMLQQMETEQSTGKAAPASKDPKGKALNLPQVQAQAAPTFQVGIIEGSEGLVSPALATIDNMWQGTEKGVYYQILAGASTEDPNQGLVIVIEVRPDQGERAQKVYMTPGKTGQMRIVEVNGTQILLSDSRDARITFDRSTRKFKK